MNKKYKKILHIWTAEVVFRKQLFIAIRKFVLIIHSFKVLEYFASWNTRTSSNAEIIVGKINFQLSILLLKCIYIETKMCSIYSYWAL